MESSRVEQLWNSSGEVLKDCALENGAILAANTCRQDYPAAAESYYFSWGRDAAFQIYAAHRLDLPQAADIRDAYLDWLLERCQGFSASGLIIKRYSPNGPLDRRYGTEYQPDQAAALLWAISETTESPDQKTDKVMRLLANGLAAQWDNTHFREPTQDLWENRLTNPAEQEVFTYTAATAAHGLERAARHLADQGLEAERDQWLQSARQIREVLASHTLPYYLRKIDAGGIGRPDNSLDASLAGLVFPFSAKRRETTGGVDQRLDRTVQEIGRQLCRLPNGVARYEGDTYDGITRLDGQEGEAGRWPLLTFWYAIALQETGQTAEAQAIYQQTIERLDSLYRAKLLPNNHIPEQLFIDNERQGQGITPLAWSHAMFVIATEKLNLS